MMTRKAILAAMKRFDADKGKVISMRMLCELAGISHDTYQNVRDGRSPMTEVTQIRLERALGAVERGEVKIMRRPDQTKFISYRRHAKPDMRRGFSLTVKGGRIAIRTGLQNASDYTRTTFGEELDGGS
jgi:hypothetical protein